jgi:hypothetical protein
MAGYIKIMASNLATGTCGPAVEEYQFSYVSGGNAWVRTFDFTGMEQFLISEVGLTPERVRDLMKQVRLQGTATIPGAEFSENQALTLGLEHMPSDE